MKTAVIALITIAAWGWSEIGFQAFFWICLTGFVGLSILHHISKTG